ncbi:Peptidyl-prolyl cis-trans isomerase NIMA-interacting protein 1 [Cichlidogyrus casuarinus]|uniref:Peptidyl-prolyl cis-trans isomerase n=1 Tax=Cichlidogyrus casuarinus TaxID=1844966 RepID=A0ABD2Q4D6_9PLAT
MSQLNQVKCSHLLVKHEGSRNPSSWREGNITRSKAKALENLNEYIVEIKSAHNPADKFAELAAKYSDCSSAKRAGDLGLFKRGMMQKPFEDASFALQVGEMSGVVDTDSGVHVILRTE